MKTYLLASLLALSSAYAQTPSPAVRDWTLPQSLAVKIDGPQSYRFTCDYHTLDVKGRLIRRERYSALYTRDLPDGSVQWTDVTAAQSGASPDTLGPAQKREFMEGFRYPRSAGDDSLKPEFFRGFPPMAMQERNLVWDTQMLEGFGQDHFEHLKLNTPYHVPDVENVALAGAGSFHHKDLQLVWTGISKRNGQECAVIDYRAFFNTLDINMQPMRMQGSSHYWGQVWVSLVTKRLEYATLYEVVVAEMNLQGLSQPMIIHVFRTGVFEPVRK